MIQWLYDGTNHKILDILVVIRLEWRIIKILKKYYDSILHLKWSIVYLNYASQMSLCMCSSICVHLYVVIENNRKFLYQGNSLAHECFFESSIPSILLSFMGWFEFLVSRSHIPSIWHSSLQKTTYFFFYIIFYFKFRTMPIKSISRVHLSHLYLI